MGKGYFFFNNMKDLHFGKLKIGGDNRVVIIAEVADSHNGSMQMAKALVDAAKEAGADVVKFQLHLPDVEMVPGSINMWDGPLYDILKRNLFTSEMHKEIMDYCEKVGIEYLCTPFCPTSVDVLESLGVKAFKTGSGELANLPQHRKLAKISAETGKPVIVSTGMSTMEEIHDTVRVYEQEGAKENLVLMNCTSEYPPNDYSHARLGFIRRLHDQFGVIVGQSDHTMDNYTVLAAVALGAKIVEKHFTLSRKMRGPDHFIALEPHMLAELISGIRKIEVGLGDEKKITEEESVVRDWAFHSVVASTFIKQGEILTLENLMPKRPGRGIPAKFLDPMFSGQLIGRRAKRHLMPNTILQWSDIE